LQKNFELSEIADVLHHLNYRWTLNALALWKGERTPIETYRIYEGYENFLSPGTLASIDSLQNDVERNRLRHSFIDHWLQKAVLPNEAEMRTWMKGAAASVNGVKIYFRDIIPWCQKFSTYETRKILQEEIRALCKFLKPFALNYWNMVLEVLKEDFGFQNYPDYCQRKKKIDYPRCYDLVKEILADTETIYFNAMEKWCHSRFNRHLDELSRFDAINLLSLRQFDSLFPNVGMESVAEFFRCWDIDIKNQPGLNLELGEENEKSAQAICVILQTPEEVYILMRPQGGLSDLETLMHELGHGLSAVFTSPELSLIDREMATSFALSESFAFLVQDLMMSKPFLQDFLGLTSQGSDVLSFHKALRNLSLFRRYGAKFISEYDMFLNNDISDGVPYSTLMRRYTGFYYQPEAHLFDLAPEFYSVDYMLGWMAGAMMEDFLHSRLGDYWMFHRDTGDILKNWWKQGNQYDLLQFLDRNELGYLRPDLMVKRWRTFLT
jgi:hypothetical protein